MIYISDIPDYEEDILRLSKTEKIDFSKAINDLLRSIFSTHVPEGVLDVIQILMWAFLICFIGWIIYKEFGSFYRAPSVDNIDPQYFSSNTEIGAKEDADIRGHNFVQELQKAVDDGDFALAIHLRYLMTLQRLDNMKRIKWQPTKTPMMYVRELEWGADKLKEITMAFLYIKYGHYPANREIFDEVTAISNTLSTMTEEGGEHE